jgi:enterochelin esterase family protein
MAVLSSLALATACALLMQNKPEPYTLGKDSQVQEGVPQGTVQKFEHISKVFAGTRRNGWLYLPAEAEKAGPLCVMIFQDGEWYQQKNGDYRVPVVLDNLMHQKKIPPMAAVFINPGVFEDKGGDGKPRSNRSFEYDTLSPQYAEFLEKEILPLAAEKAAESKAKLRTDSAGRGICGISSGGICAFTAAWQRPDLFSKVLSHVGSFTNIRGGDVYPGLIRKTAKKPIRVFLQAGANDLDNQHGHWPLANQQMAAALRFAKYDYRFEMGVGGHNGKHGGAILPESLVWLWRETPAAATGN